MSKKPIIGIAPSFDDSNNWLNIKENYYKAIEVSDGLPVIMAITDNDDCIREYVDLCDGFLIVGGVDLDASYYGEDNQKFMGETSPKRDYMEIKLIQQAINLNKPVFGICRGCQAINIAMGGSLYQDIYQQHDTNIIKHQQQAPRWHASHKVRIEKSSHMYEIFNKESIFVNTFHHQAIKKLANDFKATAFAPDGIIEAIEKNGTNFVVGVQWHPEDMWEKYDEFLNLFKYFVKKTV